MTPPAGRRGRLAAAALLSVLGWGCAGPGGGPNRRSPAATAAGPVELSLARLDGSRLELESLRGKVVLVDVWATWCDPCRRALPALSRLATSRSEDLAVVGISTDRDRDDLRRYLEANPLPYPVVLSDRSSQRLFRTRALPTVYVLDREGRIRDTLVGAKPESALLAAASRYF